MAENIKDLVIRWDGHQKFVQGKIEEDDMINIIIQKLEMILFTNKGEVMGTFEKQLGCDLPYYLWQTKISNQVIEKDIRMQINMWVPELNTIGYELDLKIFEGNFRDIMELNFEIKGYNVLFLFQ